MGNMRNEPAPLSTSSTTESGENGGHHVKYYYSLSDAVTLSAFVSGFGQRPTIAKKCAALVPLGYQDEKGRAVMAAARLTNVPANCYLSRRARETFNALLSYRLAGFESAKVAKLAAFLFGVRRVRSSQALELVRSGLAELVRARITIYTRPPVPAGAVSAAEFFGTDYQTEGAPVFPLKIERGRVIFAGDPPLLRFQQVTALQVRRVPADLLVTNSKTSECEMYARAYILTRIEAMRRKANQNNFIKFAAIVSACKPTAPVERHVPPKIAKYATKVLSKCQERGYITAFTEKKAKTATPSGFLVDV